VTGPKDDSPPVQHLSEAGKIWALRTGEEGAGGTTLIKKKKKRNKGEKRKFDL